MFDSKGVTKIQSIIMVAIIVVAGIVVYVYFPQNTQSGDTIKIGVCADLDMLTGKSTYQGVVLAANKLTVKEESWENKSR